MKNFTSLFDYMSFYKDDETCEKYYNDLRFSKGEFCVHCGHDKIYHCTSATSKKLYKCPNCNKKFNIFVNTFFENTKLPLVKWFGCIYLLKTSSKGISSVQLAKQLGVSQKTAWIMLSKIRNSFSQDTFFPSDDPVEMDESYAGGKEKNKHQSKRTPNTQGRSLKTKVAILGMVSRKTKRVKAFALGNVKGKTIRKYVENHIAKGATIYTDGFRNYRVLSKDYNREYIKHNEKEFARGEVHTNNIENFWSIFKRGYIGVYHWMSRKHIQKYIDEYTYRFNYRGNFKEGLDNLLLSSKRLTYKELVHGSKRV